MATQDLVELTKESVALDVDTINSDTTTNGNSVDMTGYQSVMFAYFTGSYTDGDYEPQVEHADDDGAGSPDTWNAVSDSDLLPTGTGQEASRSLGTANAIDQIGYRGTKKWVRLSIVSTSTSTGATVGAVVIQGHPSNSNDS